MLKIKAFTLTEMMIAISISALVIGIGFRMFTNAKTLFAKTISQLEIKEARNLFLFVFQKDFRNCQLALLKGHSIVLINDNSEIVYDYNSDFIFRNCTVPDSFEIADFNMIPILSCEGLVTTLSIQFKNNDQALTFEFNKEYSCSDKLIWKEIRP